jgi:hypothetical protein
VEIFDRQKLCDLFQDQGQPQQRAAKRLRVAGDTGPAVVLSDGLLDMPQDTQLGSCRQLRDRNSVLVSRSKVRPRCWLALVSCSPSLSLPDLCAGAAAPAVRA